MSMDRDDEASRELEEESPEPTELESALVNETLGDVVKQAPLLLDAKTPLAEAIRRMQTEHCGCALVLKGDQLAGIFTERDVLMRVAGHALEMLLHLGVVINLEVIRRVDVPLERVVVDVVLPEVRDHRRLRRDDAGMAGKCRGHDPRGD